MLNDRKITAQQAAEAKAAPLGLHLESPPNSEAPYFVDAVRRQLENEYGSFGSDKAYLAHMRQTLLRAGFTKALMYTADGAGRFAAGGLPGVPAVVNFGPGEAKEAFSKLKEFEPGMPLMSGEYWDGWYDQWGKPHQVRDQKRSPTNTPGC